MRYDITHTTVYDYSEPAALGHNLLHLEPRPHPRQTMFACVLEIDPPPEVTRPHRDYFGNPVRYVAVQQPHRRLTLVARSRIDVMPPAPVERGAPWPWEEVAASLRAGGDAAQRDAHSFVFESPYVPHDPALADYARPSFAPRRPIVDAVLELTTRIHREFRYDKRATTLATPVREVLARRAGVCQDFAHLQIGCLRAMGLAARYVSGYLVTQPPPGQPRLVGADASHAWISVFCPGCGWIDFDPTNDQLPGEHHITVAWGRDYGDVSPVRGIVLGGGESTLTVSVEVSPIETRPFA
jgi:transglutaminase-like putative cysteine protease